MDWIIKKIFYPKISKIKFVSVISNCTGIEFRYIGTEIIATSDNIIIIEKDEELYNKYKNTKKIYIYNPNLSEFEVMKYVNLSSDKLFESFKDEISIFNLISELFSVINTNILN